MGYRSDVRIILSIDGFNELSKHVKEYLKLNKLNDHYNYLKYMDVVHRARMPSISVGMISNGMKPMTVSSLS